MSRTRTSPRISVVILAMGLAILLPGCAGIGGKPTPAAPSKEAESPREKLIAHLTGTWEASGRGGAQKLAIFDKNGRLSFKNGLEAYNPADWILDETRGELRLTFPSAKLDAMQIFQMYVGQGVKSFNPNQREVTYAFTTDIWTLNIAGWEYSKPDTTTTEVAPPEPVIH